MVAVTEEAVRTARGWVVPLAEGAPDAVRERWESARARVWTESGAPGYDPRRLPCDEDVEWALFVMALNWAAAQNLQGPDGRRRRNAMAEDMGRTLKAYAGLAGLPFALPAMIVERDDGREAVVPMEGFRLAELATQMVAWNLAGEAGAREDTAAWPHWARAVADIIGSGRAGILFRYGHPGEELSVPQHRRRAHRWARFLTDPQWHTVRDVLVKKKCIDARRGTFRLPRLPANDTNEPTFNDAARVKLLAMLAEPHRGFRPADAWVTAAIGYLAPSHDRGGRPDQVRALLADFPDAPTKAVAALARVDERTVTRARARANVLGSASRRRG